MDWNALLQAVLAAAVPVILMYLRNFLKSKIENEFLNTFITQLSNAAVAAVKATEQTKKELDAKAKKMVAKAQTLASVGEKTLSKAVKQLGQEAVKELVEDNIESAVHDVKTVKKALEKK